MTACGKLVVDAHAEHGALHGCCQQVNNPCAPAFPAQPEKETGSKEKTPGRLDAHHGDAETADMLESVRHPDLWDVLDTSKDSGHDAEEIGPAGEISRGGDEEDAGKENDNQAVKYGNQTD